MPGRTAARRSLRFVEDAIRERVRPGYANTHTKSSGTGRHTTRLREQARRTIHRAVGGSDRDLVIFTGSGATGAVAKLVGLLGLGTADGPRPVVLVGPFEHHSNLLPWRESAAANVTGILSDTDRIAALLHRHGALSFWDYSAAAPYMPIRVAESRHGAGDHKDAVFFSPHKFPGGPQTPGVLVVRRELVGNPVPTVPGAAPSPSSTPSATATWTTRWPGRRPALRRSSSRSGPGWSWPSGRPSEPT